MNGLGNKLTAREERAAVNAAVDNFYARATTLGKHPGTHTLGAEYKTKKK